MNYQILQVKSYVVQLSMSVNVCTSSTSYDVEKYKKMLKIGVPLCGLQQKMMMDGVDHTFINRFTEDLKKPPPPPPRLGLSTPPPPPPPPPPPAFGFKSKDMSAVFGDIKNGNFSLKKMVKENAETSSVLSRKILRCVDTSRKVPSLSEIQDALKNLRKIN